MNLTSIREPEEIITRHFGESLFAAIQVFPEERLRTNYLVDVGSGAGFPGLPMKIWVSDLQVTLIESNQKKATFLREVIRQLNLKQIDVYEGRAEEFPQGHADVLTLRAVERFATVLPASLRILKPFGRAALLIGSSQVDQAKKLAPELEWTQPIPMPLASARSLLLGERK